MKYETPELTALTPAINAIQGDRRKPSLIEQRFDGCHERSDRAYEDWE